MNKVSAIVLLLIVILGSCTNPKYREKRSLLGIEYAEMWEFLGSNAIAISNFDNQNRNDIKSLVCFSHCYLKLKEKEYGKNVRNGINIYDKEFATTEDVTRNDFPIVSIAISEAPEYKVKWLKTWEGEKLIKTYTPEELGVNMNYCDCPSLGEVKNQQFSRHIKSFTFSGKVTEFISEDVDSGFVNVVLRAENVALIPPDYFYHPAGPVGFPECLGFDDRVSYNGEKVVINFSEQFVKENLEIGSFMYTELHDSLIYFKNKRGIIEVYDALKDFEEEYYPDQDTIDGYFHPPPGKKDIQKS